MTKRLNRTKNSTVQKQHLELRRIKPLTANQELTFDAYYEGKNLLLHGTAGTGKTFCALYLALQQIMKSDSPYKRIVIIRSVVPSRDMGFLPGSMKEKIAVYEEPYREICSNLFSRSDAYDILKSQGIIQFTSTSFMRGVTLNDAIIIMDEIQNMQFASEIHTLMTRPGDISRLIICGDFKQTDLNKKFEKEGISELIKVANHMKSFELVEFGIPDIVRSGVVREWVIACEKLGL